MVDIYAALEQKPLQSILKRKIRFVVAKKIDDQYENLRKLYPPVNPQKKRKVEESGFQLDDTGKVKRNRWSTLAKGLPVPEKVLFDKAALCMSWKRIAAIGPGMINTGSSCYLNSVLQCLTYTPALAEFCLSKQHSAVCRSKGVFCLFCELEREISRCLIANGSDKRKRPFVPSFVSKLKLIAKHFSSYRQEDAHEFLRYFIDGIQKACLSGQPEKLQHASKETSFVYSVFGGYLRSKIQCRACKNSSCTYDPFLDVSVDIHKWKTLEDALKNFVTPERLFNENKWNCSRCKKPQDAYKVITVHQPPMNLTIQLKQFSFLHHGAKISKTVTFPEVLNLQPYMSNSEKHRAPVYELYAIVVHQGRSCHSGHYYSFVRAPNDAWYMMNDDEVQQVSLSTVLRQNAYLLFYRARISKADLEAVAPHKLKGDPVEAAASNAFSETQVDRVNKAQSADMLDTLSKTKRKRHDRPVLIKPSSAIETPSAVQSQELKFINSKLFSKPIDQWESSNTALPSNDLESYRQKFINAAKVPMHKRSKYDQEYDRGKVKVTKAEKKAKREQMNPFQSGYKSQRHSKFSQKKKAGNRNYFSETAINR